MAEFWLRYKTQRGTSAQFVSKMTFSQMFCCISSEVIQNTIWKHSIYILARSSRLGCPSHGAQAVDGSSSSIKNPFQINLVTWFRASTHNSLSFVPKSCILIKLLLSFSKVVNFTATWLDRLRLQMPKRETGFERLVTGFCKAVQMGRSNRWNGLIAQW